MISKLKERLGAGAIGVLAASLMVAGALAMPATAQSAVGDPGASASHGAIQYVKRAVQIGRFANRRSVRAIRVARAVRRQSGPQDEDAQVGQLEDRIDDLEDLVSDQSNTISDLETKLAGVSRETVDGNDTLRFSDMNVQVVNDTGSTDGEPNGLGNLIIGYSDQLQSSSGGPADRDGSHYLVVGDEHEWTSFGGIVAGLGNTTSGNRASVTGGSGNEASGNLASVSGGNFNTASGNLASVSGGGFNTASGNLASVSGGGVNEASAFSASISGGRDNTASASQASISGGQDNTTDDDASSSSILGGNDQNVSSADECHPDC